MYRYDPLTCVDEHIAQATRNIVTPSSAPDITARRESELRAGSRSRDICVRTNVLVRGLMQKYLMHALAKPMFRISRNYYPVRPIRAAGAFSRVSRGARRVPA
jgi:hypothetical protein